MSLAEQVATALLAVVCLITGWVLWRIAGRTTSLATVAAGVVLGAGQALVSQDAAGLQVEGAFLAFGTLALVTYPRVLAGRSRAVAGLLVALVALGGVLLIARPDWAGAASIVLALVLIVHAWWIIERGDARDRSAMQWVATTVGFVLVAGILFSFGYASLIPESDGRVEATATHLLMVLIGAAMAVGVVRPEVIDVRWLVTTIAGTLGVLMCFLAAASMIVSGVEALTGRPLGTSIVVTLCALLALAVAPTRRWLFGTFERMLFGTRPDPISALATVADRLGDDLDEIAGGIREALALPYVRIEVAGRAAAESGGDEGRTTRVPLDLGSQAQGALVVGPRTGERSWSAADRGVIGLVAALVAGTVRAQLLSEQVAQSRAGAVRAIEEERRRLRRDLHDGVGPLLSGVVFTADAAGNLVHRDPDRSAELAQLRADAAAAIVEVRRLVEGLRPPALDELGLVEALRSWSGGLRGPGGVPVTVRFEGDEQADGLSAAGEVAAYRIAVEALTNVARHSGAREAVVRFSRASEEWRLEVSDPGVGGAWVPGTGLNSMRERSEAVGGRLVAGEGSVAVTIPLQSA